MNIGVRPFRPAAQFLPRDIVDKILREKAPGLYREGQRLPLITGTGPTPATREKSK